MREIKVAFCSGSHDLWETLIERMREIRPELELVVVSEFPVEGCEWIPWHFERTYGQNLEKLRWHFRGARVRYTALILQPRQPHGAMRRAAVRLGGLNTLFFNDNLDHFMLRPRSAGAIVRHMAWKLRNFVRWELNPGGTLYTYWWRLNHPEALLRPLLVWRAKGRKLPRRAVPPPPPEPLSCERGVSVVIPSRDGRELLERLFVSLRRELDGFTHEIIVVDNGSSDGTRAWLPGDVICEHSEKPLSFAAAVNRGIRRARYSHVLLLNNDMTLEPGFLPPLFEAFDRVPDLFCATAQILFPEGSRREETGKAVWCLRRGPEDFFLRCDEPLAGEDHSYVLYGSGGCSLYGREKLRAVGGLNEKFHPAYVEDMDLGWRGWQRGWPTVFAAGAKVVHRHRATTSRFYTARELERAVEVNLLKWMQRSVASPELFAELWASAIARLNRLAAKQEPTVSAMEALAAARHLKGGGDIPCAADERLILAVGAGEHAVFPGRGLRGRPVVLVASCYAPFPLSHGGAVRMYNLLKEASRDFTLVLMYFQDRLDPPAPELLALCAECAAVLRQGSHRRPLTDRPHVVEEFDSPVFRAVLREMVRKWRPQIAQLEFTQMAAYAKDCAPAKTVLVEHDVTLDLYAQLLERKDDYETRLQYERWERFERAAWRQVDRVAVMSEKDARAIAQPNAVVLPNGVDLERFAPGGEAPEPGRLLFIGSFAHLPNVMALDWFLKEVWPRLDGFTLHVIAGKDPEKYAPLPKAARVETEAFVADPRPAYRRAEVVIAPLLASAGTNIKILEAMAMGKAVVATPAGLNGLDDLMDCAKIARTAEEFAAHLNALRNPAARHALELAARQRVTALYGWRAIGEKQKALYQSLMPMQQ